MLVFCLFLWPEKKQAISTKKKKFWLNRRALKERSICAGGGIFPCLIFYFVYCLSLLSFILEKIIVLGTIERSICAGGGVLSLALSFVFAFILSFSFSVVFCPRKDNSVEHIREEHLCWWRRQPGSLHLVCTCYQSLLSDTIQ